MIFHAVFLFVVVKYLFARTCQSPSPKKINVRRKCSSYLWPEVLHDLAVAVLGRQVQVDDVVRHGPLGRWRVRS